MVGLKADAAFRKAFREGLQRAADRFDSARELCEREDCGIDASLLMNVLGNLGWVEYHLGNYERGKELCEMSLDFFRRTGGRGYTTSLQCRLAAIEASLGEHHRAIRYAQEALFWAERMRLHRETQDARALLESLGEAPG